MENQNLNGVDVMFYESNNIPTENKVEYFSKKNGVVLTSKHLRFGKHFADDNQNRHVFRCTLKRGEKSYSFDYGQSIIKGCIEPTMYDVLACLTKHDPGSYIDFCDNFGYDVYDKRSKKVYNAVVKEYDYVCRLFGDCMYELSYIN